MKIALITSCLAGIAHSKMAALAIKKECEKRNYQLCIEEQGGHKIPVKLTEKEILSMLKEIKNLDLEIMQEKLPYTYKYITDRF